MFKNKRPNWKFYTIAVVTASTILILLYTYKIMGKDTYKSIISNVFMSILTSAMVSLYFTIYSDRDKYIDDLEKEIHGVIEHYSNLHSKFIEINVNPLITNTGKLSILYLKFQIVPNNYNIEKSYPKLNKEIMQFKIKSLDIILECQEEYKERPAATMESLGMNLLPQYMIVLNEAFKTQEYFYQDYKGEKKKQVNNKFVSNLNIEK